MKIPSVDGVIIGPSDFTMNLGIIGKFEDKRFEDLALKVLNNCKKNDKYFGIHFNNFSLVEKWKEKGMNILIYGSEINLIKDRAKEVIKKLKGKWIKWVKLDQKNTY